MNDPAPAPFGTGPFRWHDGDRLIVFGRGTAGEARDLLGDGPFTLLTTPRLHGLVPALDEGASEIHDVPPGRVDEIAASMIDAVGGMTLVALGGGRVIDVAKAIAAADPPRRVAAVPTTLSAAEMTRVHRHAAGVDPSTPRVHPLIVVNDPELSASQPEEELAASAGNSLGHALEAPMTLAENPLGTFAALHAARLISRAWDGGAPDRDGLALASLLSGYAIDQRGYGLHHVMSQTLARLTPAAHGPANSVLLPHTWRALARRMPERVGLAVEAMGADPAEVATALAEHTGATTLSRLGVTGAQLEECAIAASERMELHATPPAPEAEELLGIYRAAL